MSELIVEGDDGALPLPAGFSLSDHTPAFAPSVYEPPVVKAANAASVALEIVKLLEGKPLADADHILDVVGVLIKGLWRSEMEADGVGMANLACGVFAT